MNSVSIEKASPTDDTNSLHAQTHLHTPHNAYRERASIQPVAKKPNEPIGDSLVDLLNGADKGKEFSPRPGDKPSGSHTWKSQVIRFYFQNVNGLRLADDGSDILDAFHQMETIGADVFGFAETKLDCRNQSIGSLIHRQKKKIWPHCKVVSSSSILPWHSTSKPGGVMLGITGPMVGRIRNTLDDDLGRWTGLDLLGRDGRNLLIICAYQVNVRHNWSHGRPYSQYSGR